MATEDSTGSPILLLEGFQVTLGEVAHTLLRRVRGIVVRQVLCLALLLDVVHQPLGAALFLGDLVELGDQGKIRAIGAMPRKLCATVRLMLHTVCL